MYPKVSHITFGRYELVEHWVDSYRWFGDGKIRVRQMVRKYVSDHDFNDAVAEFLRRHADRVVATRSGEDGQFTIYYKD